MLSGLLTGVNRTFPFAPTQPEQFEAQMDTLFRVVHIASFNKSVQALLLIFQVMFAQKNITDRFYRALYAKLLSPEIFHSTRIGLFLNVLFKAMRHDKNQTRVKAFLKRLLQVSLHQQPTFACGALFLVSEILRGTPQLRASLIKHPEPSSDVETRLGQRALELLADPNAKAAPVDGGDSDIEEDNAAPKKASNPKQGMIFFAGKPRLTAKASKLSQKSSKNAPPAEDSIQLNLGAPKPTAPVTQEREENEAESEGAIKDAMALDELSPEEIDARVQAFDLKTTPLTRYDGAARDPKYCHADCCSSWELSILSKHFHPSVSLWALHILAGHPIEYEGDPLRDMSVQAFLDRFMFKNPKITTKKKAAAAGTTKAAKKLMRAYEPPTDRAHAVNTPEFMTKASKNNVAPDELFFYKFFKQKEQLHPKDQDQKKRKVGEDEDDVEDWDSDFSMSEDEAERAVLEGLEEIEGSKIYDKKATKEAEQEEYSYSDLEESDFEEGSSVDEDDSRSKKRPAQDFDDADIFGDISDDDGENEPQLGDEGDENVVDGDGDDDDPEAASGEDDGGDNFSDDEAFSAMLAEEGELDGVGADSDEDEDAEFDTGGDDDDEEARPGKKKKSKFSRSTFASLDEFQDLLEKSGFGDQPEKSRKWDDKRINHVHRQTAQRDSGQKRKRSSDKRSGQPNKRRKQN